MPMGMLTVGGFKLGLEGEVHPSGWRFFDADLPGENRSPFDSSTANWRCLLG